MSLIITALLSTGPFMEATSVVVEKSGKWADVTFAWTPGAGSSDGRGFFVICKDVCVADPWGNWFYTSTGRMGLPYATATFTLRCLPLGRQACGEPNEAYLDIGEDIKYHEDPHWWLHVSLPKAVAR